MSDSIWKKEISFRRKPKEAKVPPVPGEEPTSIWKKEISFRRKPKAEVELVQAVVVPQPEAAEPRAPAVEHVLEPQPVAVPEPAPPRVEVPAPVEALPVVGFAAPEPAPPAVSAEPVVQAAVPEAPAAPEPAAAEPSVPFWKKEISFGKKSKTPKAEKPKRVKAEKPAKGEKPAKAEEPAKAEKPAKREKAKREKAPKVKAARGARGAKKLTGLKVGASQIAAARVANNGSAELLQVARDVLSPGIVVGGEVREPEALADSLREFFKRHRLPKKDVRLGIASNRIGVRTFDIAGIADEKQLANAISFRAQEALPIPIEDAVLDYQILSEGTNDEGEATKRVLLVVAYRELIDRYVDACRKAGITLSGIDLEAFALLRAVQAPQRGAGDDPNAALVAVSIGHDRSTFAVSDGRICEFTRVLEWGGSALNVAIARVLDATPSEVEGLKRALSLVNEDVPEGFTPDQAAKARDAARRAIQSFARELISSLQYYQSQPGSLGIGEIVVTGGTAHFPGLAGEIERLTGVRVRVADPLGRVTVSKKLGELEQVGSLAVAIGLGIED